MLPWLVAASLALVPGGTAGDLVLHVIDALGAPVPGAHVLVVAGMAVREGSRHLTERSARASARPTKPW